MICERTGAMVALDVAEAMVGAGANDNTGVPQGFARRGEATARRVRELIRAAEALGEGDLADPTDEVQAALAAMGESAGMARVYTYARRAHHLAHADRLDRMLLSAAISGVGGD
ncbi:hypothetical protein EKD04_009505 [Chloroflexales bacterium ZM16-3]|nr:hypothetical protein [Chloroflexales bacterium ZM16-3]